MGSGGGASTRLPNLKTALSLVRAGTVGARARLGMPGDSLFAGAGSNGSGGGAGSGATIAPTALRSKSMPAELANLFTAAGISTRFDAVWGGAALGTTTVANYALYNPDVSFAGTMQISAVGTTSIGGQFFQFTAAGGGSMTIVPKFNSNRLDVGVATHAGNGGVVVSDGSGTLATIDTGSAESYLRVAVTRAANTTDPFIVTIATSGVTNPNATAFVDSLVPWSTVSPMLEIWDMGWIGSKVSDWNSVASLFGPSNGLKTQAADAWAPQLGANDANAAVAAATFQTNLQTMLSNLGSTSGVSSDKMLLECHPTNPATGTSYDLPAAYRTAIRTVAANSGLITPPNFSNAGLTLSDYFDTIHLVNSGTIKEAAMLFGILRPHLGF